MSERERRAAEGVSQTAKSRARTYYGGVLRVAWRETLAFAKWQLATAAIVVVLAFLIASTQDFKVAVLAPLAALFLLFVAAFVWNIAGYASCCRARSSRGT